MSDADRVATERIALQRSFSSYPNFDVASIALPKWASASGLLTGKNRFRKTYLIIGTFSIRLPVNHAHESVKELFDLVTNGRQMFMTVDDPCQVYRIDHA